MAAYALCTPAVVLMIALLVGPILAVMALSLTDYQLGAKSLAFIGLENYAAMFGDRVFWISLTNTMIYVALSSPARCCLASVSRC